MEKHCCNMMNECMEDPGIPLFYSSIKRRYYIPSLYQHRFQSIQGLFACPWCATVLPKDLGEEYDHILSVEYDLDPYDLKSEKLPEEFKSDEWWKKRNL